jgi:hypothetical protein
MNERKQPPNNKPDISYGADYVLVCHQYIARPSYISPKQWMDFWERIIASEF